MTQPDGMRRDVETAEANEESAAKHRPMSGPFRDARWAGVVITLIGIGKVLLTEPRLELLVAGAAYAVSIWLALGKRRPHLAAASAIACVSRRCSSATNWKMRWPRTSRQSRSSRTRGTAECRYSIRARRPAGSTNSMPCSSERSRRELTTALRVATGRASSSRRNRSMPISQ
jgi:hypothetical protein